MTGALFLGLLASVCFGTSDFLGGTLTRRLPLLTVLLLSQVVGVLVTLTRLGWAEPAGDQTAALLWGAAGGVAVAVGVSSLYVALATGTMGVVAPLAALSVVVPVVAGVAAGDPVTPALAAGMVLAVVGTVLTSGPELRAQAADPGTGEPGKAGTRTGLRPILLALLSALGFGVSNLTIARGSAHHVTTTLIANMVATLLIYAVVALIRRHLPRASGRDLAGIVAIGVLGFGANLCFALASRTGALSLVAVFASLFPVVTALLGWWLHKERLRGVQLVGVVLVFAGVGVLAATG